MEVNIQLDNALKGLEVKNTEFLAAVEFATTQTGLDAVTVMKNQIKGAHKRGTPTPSKPNSPPTNITGNLRRSISSNVKRGFGLSYTATVGPTMIYSRALELGMGKNNVKYPFVLPTATIMLTTGRARATYVSALRYALSKST
jgi:hypothetical protein